MAAKFIRVNVVTPEGQRLLNVAHIRQIIEPDDDERKRLGVGAFIDTPECDYNVRVKESYVELVALLEDNGLIYGK